MSLVWLVLFAGILGWLLGIVVTAIFSLAHARAAWVVNDAAAPPQTAAGGRPFVPEDKESPVISRGFLESG